MAGPLERQIQDREIVCKTVGVVELAEVRREAVHATSFLLVLVPSIAKPREQ